MSTYPFDLAARQHLYRPTQVAINARVTEAMAGIRHIYAARNSLHRAARVGFDSPAPILRTHATSLTSNSQEQPKSEQRTYSDKCIIILWSGICQTITSFRLGWMGFNDWRQCPTPADQYRAQVLGLLGTHMKAWFSIHIRGSHTLVTVVQNSRTPGSAFVNGWRKLHDL
jgi:hypothetical protein